MRAVISVYLASPNIKLRILAPCKQSLEKAKNTLGKMEKERKTTGLILRQVRRIRDLKRVFVLNIFQ